MSKAVAKVDKKIQIKEKEKHQQALQKYAGSPLPQMREVNVQSLLESQNEQLITAYKDLNQPSKEYANRQKKNLILAVFIFAILGFGIMLGQKFGKNRSVATDEVSTTKN